MLLLLRFVVGVAAAAAVDDREFSCCSLLYTSQRFLYFHISRFVRIFKTLFPCPSVYRERSSCHKTLREGERETRERTGRKISSQVFKSKESLQIHFEMSFLENFEWSRAISFSSSLLRVTRRLRGTKRDKKSCQRPRT